jgi:hypothetical protein
MPPAPILPETSYRDRYRIFTAAMVLWTISGLLVAVGLAL